MQGTIKPSVKICCISSVQEARTAIAVGAAALALVGDMPSGPGIISDGLARAIVGVVPPPIATFLLTSETDATNIIAHHQRVKANTLQIVDELKKGSYEQIFLLFLEPCFQFMRQLRNGQR